jgi:hypothetical protein
MCSVHHRIGGKLHAMPTITTDRLASLDYLLLKIGPVGSTNGERETSPFQSYTVCNGPRFRNLGWSLTALDENRTEIPLFSLAGI